MTNITTLARSFDQVAPLYHAVRPQYPAALFEALITATHLCPQSQILEIGPGTGQATKPLAARGFAITAIELGTSLAQIARQELQGYPKVNIVSGAFEEIQMPSQSFDLVFAAIAFHWIKPGLRFAKSHQLLKQNGHLAIIHVHHVSDGQGDSFFHASQPIYQKYFPKSTNTKKGLPGKDDIKPQKINDTFFHSTHFQTFPFNTCYSGEEYKQLLNTYSPTLRLPTAKRTAFSKDIHHLIEEKFEGQIEKYFSISLTIAKVR